MLTIKVDCEEGDNLITVYDQCKELAKTFHLRIQTEFNGKICIITPDGNFQKFRRKFNTVDMNPVIE